MLRRLINQLLGRKPNQLLLYTDEQLRNEGLENNTKARWY